MLRCASRAVCWASARNRARKVASPACSLRSTFTATARSSRVSRPRHTVPIPPVASSEHSSYRPPSNPPPGPATDPPFLVRPSGCPERGRAAPRRRRGHSSVSRSGWKPGELLDCELELLDCELELELELELPLLPDDRVDDEPLVEPLDPGVAELLAVELGGGAEVVAGTEAAWLDGDAASSELLTVSGRTCTWVCGAREVVVRCWAATKDTVTTLPSGSSVPLG